MSVAYRRNRDALFPLMFLGPMLGYIYTIRPLLLYHRGELQEHLTEGQINFAAMLCGLGVALLCLGCLYGGRQGIGRIRFQISPQMRPRMVRLGILCGVLALTAYWFALWQSGGFFRVYGRAKGYYTSGSGWINESVNLAIPAAALMMLAWNRERRYVRYMFCAFLFSSPLLIHGILGARRGPTFIIVSTLLIAWYLTSRKRISLRNVVFHFGALGLLVLFLVANRQQIYIGSNVDLRWDDFASRVAPASEAGTADETVFMYGMFNTIEYSGSHYWGLRYAAIYLVRPIPRQLWPTKYEDLGLAWMKNQRDFAGIPDEEWKEALGWIPVRGSAGGFVVDLYLEFAMAGLLGCFLIGMFFGWIWSKASRLGGMWTLLFVEAASLTIYVPTQSVSAVFHRFLVMMVPTVLLWRFFIDRSPSSAQANTDQTTSGILQSKPTSRIRLAGRE